MYWLEISAMLSARKKDQMKQPMKPQMTVTGPPKPMPNWRGRGDQVRQRRASTVQSATGTHVKDAGAQQWLKL